MEDNKLIEIAKETQDVFDSDNKFKDARELYDLLNIEMKHTDWIKSKIKRFNAKQVDENQIHKDGYKADVCYFLSMRNRSGGTPGKPLSVYKISPKFYKAILITSESPIAQQYIGNLIKEKSELNLSKEVLDLENTVKDEYINSRELYDLLNIKKDYTDWIKAKIKRFNMQEGIENGDKKDFYIKLIKSDHKPFPPLPLRGERVKVPPLALRGERVKTPPIPPRKIYYIRSKFYKAILVTSESPIANQYIFNMIETVEKYPAFVKKQKEFELITNIKLANTVKEVSAFREEMYERFKLLSNRVTDNNRDRLIALSRQMVIDNPRTISGYCLSIGREVPIFWKAGQYSRSCRALSRKYNLPVSTVGYYYSRKVFTYHIDILRLVIGR